MNGGGLILKIPRPGGHSLKILTNEICILFYCIYENNMSSVVGSDNSDCKYHKV